MSTILLEDLGALLGLVFALLGVSITLITHNGLRDAAGTGMIGVLVAAKVGVPGELTAHQVGVLVDGAEARIRVAVPAVRPIYLEPDVRRTMEAAATESP